MRLLLGQATSGWLAREVPVSSSCYVKRMVGRCLPLCRSLYGADVD
jgi:hypothetical protein